jgi:hypothetical protein
MSIYQSKLVQSTKGFRLSSNNKSNTDYSTDIKLSKNNNDKQEDNSPQIKVDYKNSNYYYNNEDYFKEYPYKRYEYYNTNDNKRKYNIESNSSHITVENEDGIIKYIPKRASYNYLYNYTNYNEIPTQTNNNYIEISSHKNIDYYDDNDGSEYSENNDNENIYYENGNENDNDNEEYNNRLLNKVKSSKYGQYQNNINVYLAPKIKQMKKKSQNIISKAISHEVNFSTEKNLKIRPVKKKLHNCGNNTTTTNNTYNNNIYYINPINVKNKNKTKEKNIILNNTKSKKSNNNTKRNCIYKSVDITLQKRRNNKEKEKDYFKINNIDKSKKDIYIKAAILIQSAMRGYLVKIKLYNNVNLYVCCKRGIDILEELFLYFKDNYWKMLKTNLSSKDRMKSPTFSIRNRYKLKNSIKTKESLISAFHLEARDSFNIINKKKDNKEKKLRNKLNSVIKENKELKNKLVDNRNVEIKLKTLIDENKKNQNINAIIMKDNMHLAKKLKDLQDYRNHRLFIENQYSIDLKQIENMKIQEFNTNKEIFVNKFKKILLGKIMLKKINEEKIKIKEKLNIYRNIVQQIKNKEKEIQYKKEMFIKNFVNIINKNIKLLIDKNFWKLYFNIYAIDREYQINEDNKKEKLKKIFDNKEKRKKIILNKVFFKFLIKSIKCEKEEIKEKIDKEKEEENEILKIELLRKIFVKFEKSVRLIYKVILEKWNLKAKIIGIRTAARDKKKKRKQKKKNQRSLYNKNYNLYGNNIKNNYSPKFCKSIHEFSYIISNGKAIKESNPNESQKVLTGNKSTTNINNIVNNLNNHIDDKETKKKKTKSVNKNSDLSLKKDRNNKEKDNMNYNEESDEDSGDSFGLDNNSDC